MIILENDKWLIKKLEVGFMMVNCYIVACSETRKAFIFDPGEEPEKIAHHIELMDLDPQAIVITHGHGDHIGGAGFLAEKLALPIWTGAKDAEMLTSDVLNLSKPVGMPVTCPPADRLFKEGDEINLGNVSLKILHTPGHSLGSMSFVGDGFVIVGDVLFAGSIGRTDFPGGSFDVLISNIRQKLLPLGGEYLVLPGHGPETTIEREAKSNPFLQAGFNPNLYM